MSPPPLQFPPIPSLAVQLRQMGCTIKESQEAANVFASLAKDLQSSYESDYENLLGRLSKYSSNVELRGLTQRINRTLDARYSRRITSWLEAILQSASIRVQKRSKTANSVDERPVFKQEWTPFLKRFFAQNAYPTHRDKVVLATKTGMTVKQIYDWFQNHRTREKRKGIPLKRSDFEGPLDFSSKGFSTSRIATSVGDEIPASKNRRIATDGPLTSCPVSSTSTSGFDFFCLPPGSAWPRPYVEKDVKAFWQCPTKGKLEFNVGSLTWPRESQPHPRSPKRKASDSDIDEQLVEHFAARFNLRSLPCQRISSDTREHAEETSDTFEPWSYHRLYPKQHPALTGYTQSIEPLQYGQSPRPTKPLPRRRPMPKPTLSPCRRAISPFTHSTYRNSSLSPSPVISSPPSVARCSSWSSPDTPSTPEPPPLHLQISGPKRFEVYAGPSIGLNMLISLERYCFT